MSLVQLIALENRLRILEESHERHSARLESVLENINQSLREIKTQMSKLDDVITDLNTNTSNLATYVDNLQASLAAQQAAGAPPTDAQIASLQAISDHLKAMGTAPAAPVQSIPAAAGAATQPPPAPTSTTVSG